MESDGCDAELRLGIGHDQYESDSALSSRRVEGSSTRTAAQHDHHQHQQQQQQQLTLFYNGRICVFDVAEIQARAIISMARREMESERRGNNHYNQQGEVQENQRRESPPTPRPDQHSTNSMPFMINQSRKRSLQTFLENREARIKSSAPYK